MAVAALERLTNGSLGESSRELRHQIAPGRAVHLSASLLLAPPVNRSGLISGFPCDDDDDDGSAAGCEEQSNHGTALETFTTGWRLPLQDYIVPVQSFHGDSIHMADAARLGACLDGSAEEKTQHTSGTLT